MAARLHIPDDENEVVWIIRHNSQVQRAVVVARSTGSNEREVCLRTQDGNLLITSHTCASEAQATVELLRQHQVNAAAHTANATRLMEQLARLAPPITELAQMTELHRTEATPA
ncbi:MAG: hypothetical protein R3B90_21800 [Planctomycetaceae bacterium]